MGSERDCDVGVLRRGPHGRCTPGAEAMRAGGVVGASLAGWMLDAEGFPERDAKDAATVISEFNPSKSAANRTGTMISLAGMLRVNSSNTTSAAPAVQPDEKHPARAVSHDISGASVLFLSRSRQPWCDATASRLGSCPHPPTRQESGSWWFRACAYGLLTPRRAYLWPS